jgi:hypothetical protein
MRETLVKGSDAGKEKSEPRSQTSACISSAGGGKIYNKDTITWMDNTPARQKKSNEIIQGKESISQGVINL